ncbi:MAG: flagellar type III secretion system protein FliR [Campylobacterales bacterium]
MELVAFLTDGRVVGFILLFARFSSLLAFLPFFSHMTIPVQVKAALAFYLTILFFPMVQPPHFPLTAGYIIIALLSEATFGFVVGLILQFVLGYLVMAGEKISMVMGFSMASTIDPMTMQNSPIISQFLNMMALMFLLLFDGHHWMIEFIGHSLTNIPLGGFLITEDLFNVSMKMMANLFAIGFMIAFPIMALSLLSDIIFGMIMKTIPTFNLLVIGFPVKIAVSILVLIAVMMPIMTIFQREFEATMALLVRLYG